MPHRYTTPPRRGRTPSKPGAVAGQVQSLPSVLGRARHVAPSLGQGGAVDGAFQASYSPDKEFRLLS